MFEALDIIPFRNNVLKMLGLLIVTKTIDAFTFEMHGVVWGELLLQHDSSVYTLGMMTKEKQLYRRRAS